MRTEIKHENTKTTLMVLLITQNTHENTKIPPKKASFLFFSKAKNIILLYIEIEKILNSLVLQPIFFLHGQRHILIVTNIMKSQESSWSTILNFVDSRGKRVFLLC